MFVDSKILLVPFALSLIRRLFTNSSSLRVAWTRKYLLKQHSFW